MKFYKTKFSVHAQHGKLKFEAGWFRDEPFSLLSIKIFDTTLHGWTTVLGLTITHLSISVSWVEF